MTRPFVIISFDQRIPGAPNRDSNTGQLSGYSAWGILTLKNVGNSPAFNVSFVLTTNDVQCIKLGHDITIAAHDELIQNPEMCISNTYKQLPDPASYTLYNVAGHVTYSDAYGVHYQDPITVPVQFGGQRVTPNKL